MVGQTRILQVKRVLWLRMALKSSSEQFFFKKDKIMRTQTKKLNWEQMVIETFLAVKQQIYIVESLLTDSLTHSLIDLCLIIKGCLPSKAVFH